MGIRPRRSAGGAGASTRGGRSRLVLAALPWLVACSNLSDRGLAARAGDWTLTEQRLAELLVLAQPYPLDSLAVDQLADLWVSAAALSQRAAAGDSLLGSEARDASTWLDRREALLEADRRERLGADAARQAGPVDEVFRQGALRLIAHTLRRVGPETSSSERLLQQRTAERLLATLAEGGGWDQVVAESEDPESRQRGGLLGLFAAGELPSTLDRVAFRLEPGQVSGVTQSSRGYHLLYRPRLDEVETLFAELLFERTLAQADAGAAEGARVARGFTVSAGAQVVIARMAEDPAAWLDSEHVLATWDGGALSARVAARVLLFLPPESLAELIEADQEARTQLLNDLGTRELRVVDAAERGAVLDPAVADNLSRLHDEEIEYWARVLELDGPDAPSEPSLAGYMEAVAARRETARSMPPLFEAWVLGRIDTRVRPRGVLAAIVIARRMLTEAGNAAPPGS